MKGDATGFEVSVPPVTILGPVVFVTCRYMGLRVWQAILFVLFGFFIAAAAPEIRNLVTAIVQELTSSQPCPSSDRKGVMPSDRHFTRQN